MNQSLFKSPAGYEALQKNYQKAVDTAPVPYTSHWLDTSYGRSHVLSGGNPTNPPLVLFHGWNGHAAGIGHEFPFLFDHYHVFMPDLIGHPGRSAPTRPSTATFAYAQWVVELLDQLQLPQVAVMGISGGGWMVLKLSAYVSARLTAAIAINPAGLTHFFHPSFLWAAAPVMWKPSLATARYFVKNISVGSVDDPKLEEFAAEMYPIMAHFKTMMHPRRLPDHELQQIKNPLLLVSGDKDVFFPHYIASRAQKHIPQVESHLLPHTGHVLLTPQVEQLRPLALNFLQKWSKQP